MTKDTLDALLAQANMVSAEERETLILFLKILERGRKLEEHNLLSATYWRRDPFLVAKDLCGAVLQRSYSGEEGASATIIDVRGWRTMDPRRAVEFGIAEREQGTVHVFPLRMRKPGNAGPYHLLGIVVSSAEYPTCLVTLNGLRSKDKKIPGTRVFSTLGIEERDTANVPFLIPGVIDLICGETVDEKHRTSYTPEGFSADLVQGYKVRCR